MSRFKFNNKQNTQPSITESTTEHVALSGWRYELPNHSNLPITLTDAFMGYGQGGYIPFGYTGSDMLFPQMVEQSIYEASPAHNACIRLVVKSAIGKGFDLLTDTTEGKLDAEKFKSKNKLRKLLKEITQDYRLHNRINIKVTKASNGTLSFERVSPAKIAYNNDLTKFYFCNDFSAGMTVTPIDVYTVGCKPGTYMIQFDGTIDKYAPYPAPEWISGFPAIKINSKIPEFHERNMEESINAGLVITTFQKFKNDKDKSAWLNGLRSKKGMKGVGSTILLTADSKDSAPDVKQLDANKNEGLFKELRESTIDDICMAHNVNPVLIGVKTPGALGANQEAQHAYNLLYSVVIEDVIEHIEWVINELISMSDIKGVVFKLVENRIWSVEQEQKFNKLTIE